MSHVFITFGEDLDCRLSRRKSRNCLAILVSSSFVFLVDGNFALFWLTDDC